MKSLIALSLLICMGTASASKADDLYISISLTTTVHGTGGSRWTKNTYTIRGNKIVYKETYGGEIASERLRVHKEYTFTAQEMSNLKRLIKEKDLLRSRSETSPPGNVPYIYFDLTEEVRWQGKRSLIKVSLPRTSLHSDAMKDSQLYQDADALLEDVRAVVNLKGSEIRADVRVPYRTSKPATY
jgi:hypothetical protein